MGARLIAILRARRVDREPAAKVTERSARSDLYGWPRSIDVAPRTVPKPAPRPEADVDR